jgi:hypothetical protein
MPFASAELPAVLGVCIPIFALSIPIVAIISTNWRKAKVAEFRAISVQNMLDKGFTPDEIERVLRASDSAPDKLVGKCESRRRRRDSEYA